MCDQDCVFKAFLVTGRSFVVEFTFVVREGMVTSLCFGVDG